MNQAHDPAADRSVAAPEQAIDRTHAKRCSACHRVKSLAEFSKNRASRDGHRPYCKPCDQGVKRAARARQREAKGLSPRLDPSIDRTKEKRCSRCRAVKPLDAFGTNAATRDGHSNYCRPCESARARERVDRQRAARGLPPLVRPPAGLDRSQEKWCPGCHEVKPLAAFYRTRHASHGHYARCKTCVNTQRRERSVQERAAQGLPPIAVAPPFDHTREKWCRGCQQVKALAAFHRNGPNRHASRCRTCLSAKRRADARAHAAERSRASPRRCTGCRQMKPASAFDYRRRQCKACRAAYRRAYRARQ